MKQTITTILILISLSAFSQQKDTVKKSVPDSVLSFPDSVTLKIPASLIQTFGQVLGDGDYSHKEYLRLVAVLSEQINKQYTKKPKK